MKKSVKNRSVPQAGQRSARHGGFTLVQVLVVMGIISVLAAMVTGVFGRGRTTARRAQCDVKLKTIALALDTHRQEKGRFPATLTELRTGGYLTDPDALRCSSDPRANASYEEFYTIRGPRDSGELPIVVCPFHEKDSKLGPQAYVGRYTKQFATKPARLASVRDTTVTSPGKAPMAATAGQELHGGDLIKTGLSGAAVIRFVDGSTSELKGDSEITVLQSYREGQANAPLYTMVRQWAGDVIYRVNNGSKFDVVTPTATAGALGTVFEVRNARNSNTGAVMCSEGTVRLSTVEKSVIIPTSTPTNVIWVPFDWTAPPAPIATPVPTPCYDHNKGKGNGCD